MKSLRRRRLFGVEGALSSFRAMKGRCYYTKHVAYASYGGRGISIASEWLGRGGFAKFLAHVGPRPKNTTIDRINPDGNYEPGNVRWASYRVQYDNVTAAGRDARVRGRTRARAQRGAKLARASLRVFGRILGFQATENLMQSIRDELEERFGPPRNMQEPLPGTLSVEDAFLTHDYSMLSEHWAGLDNLAAEWRGHGDWVQLTGATLDENHLNRAARARKAA